MGSTSYSMTQKRTETTQKCLSVYHIFNCYSLRIYWLFRVPERWSLPWYKTLVCARNNAIQQKQLLKINKQKKKQAVQRSICLTIPSGSKVVKRIKSQEERSKEQSCLKISQKSINETVVQLLNGRGTDYHDHIRQKKFSSTCLCQFFFSHILLLVNASLGLI